MNGVYYVRIAAYYWIYWIPAPRVVHKIHITRDVHNVSSFRVTTKCVKPLVQTNLLITTSILGNTSPLRSLVRHISNHRQYELPALLGRAGPSDLRSLHDAVFYSEVWVSNMPWPKVSIFRGYHVKSLIGPISSDNLCPPPVNPGLRFASWRKKSTPTRSFLIKKTRECVSFLRSLIPVLNRLVITLSFPVSLIDNSHILLHTVLSAILIKTSRATYMWDCNAFLSEDLFNQLRTMQPPLKAIAISHPHVNSWCIRFLFPMCWRFYLVLQFFSTSLTWSRCLKVPLILAAADKHWFQRLSDVKEGEIEWVHNVASLEDGVTMIQCGG